MLDGNTYGCGGRERERKMRKERNRAVGGESEEEKGHRGVWEQ